MLAKHLQCRNSSQEDDPAGPDTSPPEDDFGNSDISSKADNCSSPDTSSQKDYRIKQCESIIYRSFKAKSKELVLKIFQLYL